MISFQTIPRVGKIEALEIYRETAGGGLYVAYVVTSLGGLYYAYGVGHTTAESLVEALDDAGSDPCVIAVRPEWRSISRWNSIGAGLGLNSRMAACKLARRHIKRSDLDGWALVDTDRSLTLRTNRPTRSAVKASQTPKDPDTPPALPPETTPPPSAPRTRYDRPDRSFAARLRMVYGETQD